jgi:hypothetical protein
MSFFWSPNEIASIMSPDYDRKRREFATTLMVKLPCDTLYQTLKGTIADPSAVG